MVKLIMKRYGRDIEFTHETVMEAAKSACADIETNEAAPVKILKNSLVVWENADPMGNSYANLRLLAGLIDA